MSKGAPHARYEEIVRFVRSMDFPDDAARQYTEIHLRRIGRTLELVPPPRSSGRILELGAYMQMTPALQCVLGYTEVRGAYFGPLGRVDEKSISVGGREVFRCFVDLFNAEKDRYPYADGHFETVLACEIFEHLIHDPMHLLIESNRILEDQGSLILTTPNVASYTAVARVLEQSGNPQLYSKYADPRGEYAETEIPHVREYTPRELTEAIESAGFEVTSIATEVAPGYDNEERVKKLLERLGYPTELRGEQMFCVARKRAGKPITRYPKFLYDT
jgi:SAM-dependent methyltransferase